MSKRPNTSQNLALRVAAAARAQEDEEEQAPELPPSPIVADSEIPAPPGDAPSEPDAKPRGRPRGRRAVEARQTVYLDKQRHAALLQVAEAKGCSVHSLILQGIDIVTGRPTKSAW